MILKFIKKANKIPIFVMLLLSTACPMPELQAGMSLNAILSHIRYTFSSVAQGSMRSLQQFFYSMTSQGVGPFQQTDLIPSEQDSPIIPAMPSSGSEVKIPASAVYSDVEYPGTMRISTNFSTKAVVIPDGITQVQAPEVVQEVTETVIASLDNPVQEIVDGIDSGTEITETVTATSLVEPLDSDVSVDMKQVSSNELQFLPVTKRIGAFLARTSFDVFAETKRTFLEHPILTTTAIVASIGCVARIYGWIKTKSQKAQLAAEKKRLEGNLLESQQVSEAQQQELADLKREYGSSQTRFGSAMQAAEVEQDRIFNTLLRKWKKSEAEAEEVRRSLADFEVLLASYQQEKQRLEEDLSENQQAFKELQVERTQLLAEQARCKQSNQELIGRSIGDRNKIFKYEGMVEASGKRVNELETQLNKVNIEQGKLRNKLHILQITLDRLEEDKRARQTEAQELRRNLNNAYQKLKKSRTETGQLEESKAQMEADLADRLERWTNQIAILQKQIDALIKERKNIEQVNMVYEVESHQSDSKQQDDEEPQAEFEGVGHESTVEPDVLRSRVSSKRSLALAPSKKKEKKSVQDLTKTYREALEIYNDVVYAIGSSQADKDKASTYMEECEVAWLAARRSATYQVGGISGLTGGF